MNLWSGENKNCISTLAYRVEKGEIYAERSDIRSLPKTTDFSLSAGVSAYFSHFMMVLPIAFFVSRSNASPISLIWRMVTTLPIM